MEPRLRAGAQPRCRRGTYRRAGRAGGGRARAGAPTPARSPPHIAQEPDPFSAVARMTRIGTAGWSIPPQHAERFDRTGSHLCRYAARFNAVEINSSFYRPHQPKTYARWAASVPEDF